MTRSRRSLARSLGVIAAAFLAACSDSSTPTGPSLVPGSTPGRSVSDAANGGRAGFYFLAPVLPTLPSYPGTFDPGVQATVRICTPIATCASPVATFTVGGAPGAAITVDVARQAYVATWAVPSSLTLGTGNYRLEVTAAGARIGYADLNVVATAAGLSSTPAGYVGVVRGANFTIRFRIETGTIGVVDVQPPTATIQVGGTQDFTATVRDLHGNPIASPPTINWASSATGVATVSPTTGGTTTATGVGVGSATITATSGPATGSASLTVNTSQVAPTAQPDTYGATVGQTLTVPAAGVLANDALGTPAGTVASFGGGSLGGAVTDHAAGSTVTVGSGGSLTLNADGSLSFVPPTGFSGNFTFQYRLTNAAGSSDATVTIDVKRAPSAVNDSYTATVAAPLTVSAPGLLGNDDLGAPAGAITSFGGGSFGGAVTSWAPGATATDANGGTLVVNADGSFTYTPTATSAGTVTFQYRLTNTAGFSDGTVTIDVRKAPSAVNDAYAAPLSGSLTTTAATGVLANDDRGVPVGNLASFGGGSLGGAVTDHAAGSTVTFGSGGSLTVNADGSFTFTPASGFTGAFTFQYRLTNAAGSSDATVTIDVKRAPSAVNDSYTAPLSGPLTVAAPGVLANDDRGVPTGNVSSFGGGSFGGVVTSWAPGATATDANGGTLVVNADGSFTYTPSGTFSGTVTFQYRLTNTAGSSDATVTITVPKAPNAVADAYTTPASGAITISAPGLLGNDDLGFPAGALTTFGGGSLGGSVGDHAAGATVTFGSGGSLAVNADGSFSFTRSSGFSGVFTFQYRLANAFASSVATVTITVPAPPDAVNDGPAAGSAPGQAYHTALNTAITIPGGASPSILSNDNLGTPAATVVSFGGGSLGGTAADHAAGTSASSSAGTVTIAADGTLTYTPATGFTGLFTVDYKLQNSGGSDVATVTIAVGVRPSAVNDTYSPVILGNVAINTSVAGGTGFSVIANDQGDQLVITPGAATNGSLALDPATGRFQFVPARGYEGPASFTYMISNGFGSSTATVNLTVSGMVWFINASAAAGGNGTNLTPYNAVASFSSVNNGSAGSANPEPNDDVYIASGAYTGPLTLQNGQGVFGQGATGSSFSAISGRAWPADAGPQPAIGGTRPTITSSANDVDLGNGNELRGVDLGNAAGTALKGTNIGTFTFADVGITTTGQALDLANGTLSGSFSALQSTGGANNVALSSVNGTSTFGTSGNALSGATGDAFKVNGGSATIAYPGTISNSNTLAVNVNGIGGGTLTFSGDINPSTAGRGISVTSSSGGSAVVFSGANQKISSGASAGVAFASNSNATLSFTGGGLNIATTSGSAFSATGGGTINVTGGSNAIATTGGVALAITNTTIGGSGVTFRSVAASGGSTPVSLSNTGTGTFTITGDGASDAANTTRGRTTAKSGGGSLGLGSGGVLSATTATAFSASNTGPIVLRNFTVQSGGGDGIAATAVNGLTLDNVLINAKAFGYGLHGTSVNSLTITHTDINNNATDASTAGPDIWNVRLDNLVGAATVQSSTFNHGYEHIFVVKNTTATATFTVTNSDFTDAGHGDGLDVYAYGSSNLTANVSGSTLARNSSFGFDSGTETGQSGVLNVTLNNNAFTNNFVGLDVAHGSSGTNTFSITNNNLQTNVTSSSQAININRLGSPSFTNFGLFSGTISGNTIGTAGIANSGSDVGDGITVKTNGNGGEARVTIINNTIRSYGQHGIAVAARDASSGHILQARIQNNNIANGEPTLSLDGINVTMGALNTDHITMCLDIGGAGGANGNTVSSAVRNGIRVRSSGLPAAVIALTMPAYDNTGATYLANRNPLATGASGNTSFSNASGTTTAGNCTTP